MKIKLLKTIGIIGCLGIVGATPVMLTSCKKKSTSQSATVTPQLKTKLTGVGGLDEFITTSSKADDVNKNLKDVLNNNIESVIANWESIPQNEQNSINLNPTFKNWTNDAWGAQTFDDWSSSASAQKVDWKGSGETPTASEELKFNSNSELKKFLNDNISKIAKNAIGDLGTKKASLANADIKVDDNGNLLVPFLTNDSTQSPSLQKETREVTNYYISIPSSVIKFNPTINLQATYGSNQSVSSEISFVYTVTNVVETEETFKTEVATTKNTITLDEKENTNSTIGLWEKVTDADILKKLGWLDSNESLGEDHVDGEGIDVSLLNEDAIISDLNINGLTKDKLLGIEIQMNQRNVSQANYNGEYTILVSTTGDNSQSVDLNLKFNTYKVVSQKTTDGGLQSLQVNVPNAYFIESIKSGTDSANDFGNTVDSHNTTLKTNLILTKDNYKGQLKLGAKTLQDADANISGTKIIVNNFELNTKNNAETTFLNQLVVANADLNWFNAIDLKYKGVAFSSEQNTESSGNGNILKFEVKAKKGFEFKKEFTSSSKKYNTSSMLQSKYIYIAFNYESVQNSRTATIIFDKTKDLKTGEIISIASNNI